MIISDGRVLDFAPQALGEVTPTLSNGYFYATQGMSLASSYATYAALYRAQPAIATLVDKVANAAARLTVRLWDVTSKQGRTQDTTSPLARLLARPTTEMSPFNFWRWTVSTYEVYGEAFWYKQRANVTVDAGGQRTQSGPVVNLLPMHPSRTAVRRNKDGEVEYVFTLGVASAGLLTAPAEDVVAFLRFNPDNLMRGLSRLEPLRSTLLNEDAARRANASWWKRGARPSVVLEHPNTLSQDAMDRIKAQFDAKQSGADNMGGSAVLQEGMKANVIQLTAEEMQYIESRKLNMQEACMVYDVPPPVVHILDHATFSNITEQMRSMYRDTMSPRLEDLESVIDFGLTSEFFAPGQRETEFDMTDVLRGDFEVRADKAAALRQSGIFTGNQSLELVGLPKSDDPEMDKVYANASLVPLGTPTQRVTITEQATPTPQMNAEAANVAGGAADAAAEAAAAQPPKKALTLRALQGRLARVKASKPELRAKLVDEHAKELGKFFDTQRESVKTASAQKDAAWFDPTEWDAELAGILHTLSQATAEAIGRKVASDLGGKYDGADIADWLKSNSDATAQKINQATADEIAAAIENGAEAAIAVDNVFDGEVPARTGQIALSRVALIGGFASLVAARQSNAATKTWITGPNPRPLHQAVDGETVGVNERFSNGMDGPGDYAGGADEVAGCNCDLEFGF